MKHTLETDGFKLELQAKFFEEDEQYPVNATLQISVASGRFGGAACWDLDFRQLKEFVGQLMRLYQALKGEVRLCEKRTRRTSFLRLSGTERAIFLFSGS